MEQSPSRKRSREDLETSLSPSSSSEAAAAAAAALVCPSNVIVRDGEDGIIGSAAEARANVDAEPCSSSSDPASPSVASARTPKAPPCSSFLAASAIEAAVRSRTKRMGPSIVASMAGRGGCQQRRRRRREEGERERKDVGEHSGRVSTRRPMSPTMAGGELALPARRAGFRSVGPVFSARDEDWTDVCSDAVDASPPRVAAVSELPSDPTSFTQLCGVVDGNDDPLPIYHVGADAMACCLSYLDPVEVYALLTAPLSKSWRRSFAVPQDLWRALCLSDPFRARLGDEAVSEGGGGCHQEEGSLCHYPVASDPYLVRKFGVYRLLYGSFVRCARYLRRISDDVARGARAPSVIDDGVAGSGIGQWGSGKDGEGHLGSHHPFRSNSSLRCFLSKARDAAREKEEVLQSQISDADDGSVSSTLCSDNGSNDDSRTKHASNADSVHPIDVPVSGTSSKKIRGKRGTVKRRQKKDRSSSGYSQPSSTERPLQGRTTAVTTADLPPEPCPRVENPWSCAVYAVVNWMAAFPDVSGVQSMCLGVMPSLLQRPEQRATARRAGLADVLLRSMLLFPEAAELHIAAFHALVLLARPVGGAEGMLRSSDAAGGNGGRGGRGDRGPNGGAVVAIDAPPVLDARTAVGQNGAAILLDSMRRFVGDGTIQAYGCWSMVNLALVAGQKSELVKSGGIMAAASAMAHHRDNAEVQFRALFALINLVIPAEDGGDGDSVGRNDNGEVDEFDLDGGNESDNWWQGSAPYLPLHARETRILDEAAPYIIALVVASMKNFCSCEAVLNRACLVVHNLSLSVRYHEILLLTPDLFRMVEWSMANYCHDQVLQRSAGGTLQRLQATLSRDRELRARFLESIRVQSAGARAS